MDGQRDDWGPWIEARFATSDARDRFLAAVAGLASAEWDAEPMTDADEDPERGAWVRWRRGAFLALNDVAYSHGGRIGVPQSPRKIR